MSVQRMWVLPTEIRDVSTIDGAVADGDNHVFEIGSQEFYPCCSVMTFKSQQQAMSTRFAHSCCTPLEIILQNSG
jgi:hypothetical protein